MIKLLWIDDNLDHDLAEFRIALRMHGGISPDFARNASEAYARLLKKTYDVVIFDLRLPPGPDDMWDDLYKAGEQKFGFVLLEKIHLNTGSEGERFNINGTKFGVFSIEPSLENSKLFQPPINLLPDNFKEKVDAVDKNDFIKFILNVNHS
ncbi:MAG: hypothetical protein ACKVUS_08110 [Saprospiraceae bacterium]